MIKIIKVNTKNRSKYIFISNAPYKMRGVYNKKDIILTITTKIYGVYSVYIYKYPHIPLFFMR
jgi:hypothetical protein